MYRSAEDETKSMSEKERTYLAAILGSAEGYVEANLTTDTVIEFSDFYASMWGMLETKNLPEGTITYSEFNAWVCHRLVVKDIEKVCQICSREYLLKRFDEGERRASVQFYSHTKNGGSQPCRFLIFLYQDNETGEVHAFGVLYDLTEQQRKDLELKKLEEELQMRRISNFTSQMQPHFLYNTLGSIQEIMHEDPEYASDLLGDFALHLRSCIRAMSTDKPLPFRQELANIKAYVNIEKMRFGDKLKVEYDIQTMDFNILPLSVQPLVENAIRHGIYERGPAGGTVKISTRKVGGAAVLADTQPASLSDTYSVDGAASYIVEVEDDGVGFDVEAERQNALISDDHTGLKNLIFRLKAVQEGEVEIQSKPGEGTKVTISLPAERSSE